MLTFANVTKCYIGISMISVSKSISRVGIYGSLIGFAYVASLNLYSLWLLLKARNRYKYDRIVDLPDLCARVFGEHARKYVDLLLIVT